MNNQDSLYELLLNLPGLSIDSVEVLPRRINIKCHTKALHGHCPICGQPTSTVNQRSNHRLRDLGIANREVYLLLKVKQYVCKSCNRYFSEALDFADLGKSYTHRQADFMFLVGRKQSYTETALVVNMSPKTVERVVLDQSVARVDLGARYAQLRRLGIDELSHRKGKGDYICVLTDLDRGTVVDILPDRKKATLIAHFEALGKDFCAQITHVSCDLWDAYLGVAQACFPQAQVVLDRFHVTKMLNEGLDDYRKSLRRKEPKVESYRRLKHILGKQYHTLSDASFDYLAQAFECDGGRSGGLYQRYFLREDFHHILEHESTIPDAEEALTKWVAKVEAAQLPEFDTFIKMVKKHSKYILNYVIDQVSNAVTEGLNNLIRSIKRIAWGMPSFAHLRLRVLACSE